MFQDTERPGLEKQKEKRKKEKEEKRVWEVHMMLAQEKTTESGPSRGRQ